MAPYRTARAGETAAEGFLNGDKVSTWFRSLFTFHMPQTPPRDGQDFLQGKVPLVYAGGWKVLKACGRPARTRFSSAPDFRRGCSCRRRLLALGVSSSKNADVANKFIEFLMQDK